MRMSAAGAGLVGSVPCHGSARLMFDPARHRGEHRKRPIHCNQRAGDLFPCGSLPTPDKRDSTCRMITTPTAPTVKVYVLVDEPYPKR